ncbi:hypothetical protein H5125_20110 [Shewanella sp. SR44-4]|uniref:WD40 repeat domain-containing protein n=1 Tax=unclassified Shewanella TaxID=196818 RepID=UPI001602C79A|nr:hypothetical protein [Shewanella sp. SR44-4]MBB1364452.1 hypothetical protein [Shewanella sp. SR44-4]
MSSPVLERYQTKTLAEVEKLSRSNEIKLSNGYHVEWHNSHEFDLICEDEDIHQTINIHEDKVTAVVPLQHKANKDYFVTVGLDHTAQVFKFYGEHVASLDEHGDVIIGVFELADGQIVTASKDETLRFWNPRTGVCYSTIEAKIDSIDSVQFFAHQKQLAVNEPDGISICRFSGEQIIKLKGQIKPLKSLYQLSSGNWLTWSEGENPTLWSDSGESLKRFNFNFLFENGFIEKTAEQQLLIKNVNEQVSLWQNNGTLIDSHVNTKEASLWQNGGTLSDSHVNTTEVSDLFTALSKALEQVNLHIEEKPTINHYPHLRNFIGNKESKSVLVPARVLELQKLNFDEDAKQKELWDYFNRPIPRELTTAMKREVKAARSAEKVLNQKIKTAQTALETHQKKRGVNKIVSLVMLFLTLVTAGVGSVLCTGANAPDLFNQLAGEYISGFRPIKLDAVMRICAGVISVPLLFCLIFFMKNRSQKTLQLLETGNLTLLNALLPEYCKLIDKVKAHRAQLWKSVPLRKNRNLYSGESVNATMKDIIENQIEKQALHSCGLEKADVIYSNHEAIVLSDWALIQSDERRAPALTKLHGENELSFWGDNKGSLVFAVQYIQFIFLTADKIDLFTGFYDFINQEMSGKSSKSFFYKDVTTVTKDDVDRQTGIGKETISAIDVNLVVSSGDKIRLTILTQESLKSIVEAAKDNEEKERVSNHSILKSLEARKKSILEDTEMDEDEREEELDDVETQIKSMNEENAPLDNEISNNKAEEAIKNIRHQLKLHKQERNEETVS